MKTKNKKMLHFDEDLLMKEKKALTLEKLINKDFLLNTHRVNTDVSEAIITRCIEKVLNDNGIMRMEELIDGDIQCKDKISPEYRLAWNTLRELNIIMEVK